MLMEDKKLFVVCEECGKKIIERLPNGLFYFVFGKRKDKDGNLLEFSPVELFVHGSIKIRCLSRTCGHWNILNYFPQSDNPETTQKIRLEKGGEIYG